LVSSGWVPILPGKGVLYGGGIEAQVYGLSKALTKYCEEVHLVTVQTESHTEQNTEGIIYHKLTLPSKMPAFESMIKLAYSDLMFAYKSRRLCQKLDVDIVHCNTKFPAVASLLKRLKQPLVFTAHNWKLWEGIRPEWKNSFARTAFELDVRLERFIAQKADKILAVSGAMKRGIVGSTGMPSERVEVVPNAVDLDVFYPEVVERKHIILYVGRITAEKGVDVLVKAMPLVLREASDAKLVIVGPRRYGFERGGFEEQLMKLVRSLGIERHVVFVGSIPVSDLRKTYSTASVLCLPSVWQEPFGLTLIEAMACEAPVIGTKVGGIPEIVSKTKAGLLVEPYNAEDLANAILKILLDTRLARSMGRKGRRAVKENYTFDSVTQKLYSTYLRLLEQGSGTVD